MIKGNKLEPGIIPQTLKYIYEISKRANHYMEIHLNVSYLEIHDENLIDLLDLQKNKSLDI